MKKNGLTCLIIIILILGSVYYKSNSNTFKINKSKIKSISYIYEIDNNKMAEFDITKNLNEKDINSIVDSLNNGKLTPDKNKIGKYTLEHIEMLVLGDRWFSIYKQKDGSFTVMYQIDKGSNAEDSTKQTTINSEVLQSYFIKYKQLSKSLVPKITWDIKDDTLK